MLRLNLLARAVRRFPWHRPAIALLALALLVQGVQALRAHDRRAAAAAEAARWRERLTVLDERWQKAAAADEADVLAGALAVRNAWQQDRALSPVAALARVVRDRPAGCRLLSFSGRIGAGSLELVAGDMDTAARFLHATFPNGTQRLTLADRTAEGLRVSFAWTERP
jgi:hypothetical protein